MKHILFNDYRQPAAAQAYEIAFDFLARSGAIRDEFETCVFLVQRLTTMIEEGQTNRILMANRAISEHERYVAERDARTRRESHNQQRRTRP
ncbi:hypothetical protein ACTGJ9_013790 [Bradyrhizobium sp. RDM12]